MKTGAQGFIRFVCLAVLALPAMPAPAAETLTVGRFEPVTVYRPQAAPRATVLFLSGDGGWNAGVIEMAQALAAQGMLVAGIDTPRYFRRLEQDGASCVYPDGDLENLSHFLQAYLHLPDYRPPVLVGYSSGASLAYAMLAQAPSGTFAGAVSLGFCPELGLGKPLCPSGTLKTAPKKTKDKGVNLLPSPDLGIPWVVLQGEQDQACPPAATQKFTGGIQGARIVSLPRVGHGYSVTRNWMPQFLAAVDDVVPKKPAEKPASADIAGLPLVELPAKDKGDRFAILMSGDGGWAGLDKNLAASLSASGISVVGVDSLRYFWSPRTPASAAADMDRIIRHYRLSWNRPQVLLLGYSQGADVLPFILNRLSPDSRKAVVLAAALAPGLEAHFEFRLSQWLGKGSAGLPTLPEMQKLSGQKVACVYGADEKNSLCSKLDPGHFRLVALPGTHHFNGDYATLGRVVIQAADGG